MCHPMWDLRKFLVKRFKGKAHVSSHFILRLFQRFDHSKRMRILVELNELFRHDMYRYLIDDDSESTKVTIQGVTMCIAAKGAQRITLKTIY